MRASATPPASTPLKPDVRARTVRFEKAIAANRSDYAIYQVQVTAHGIEKTEIGDIAWTYPQPLTMYTLRAAAAGADGQSLDVRLDRLPRIPRARRDTRGHLCAFELRPVRDPRRPDDGEPA